MKNYQSELPSLEAQIAADLAEGRKRSNDGIDLTPIFAQLESFMYRFTRLERQNLEFEKRIAELEAARQAPLEFWRLTVKMNLEAKQREMRERYARKPKTRGPRRAPKLERGITVAPVRRRKPFVDLPELQALLCAHLRSPKIKASDFAKLLDLGTRYGLMLPDIRPIPAEEAEAPNNRQDLSPELREVLRMEKEMREQRKKEQETKKTQ